MKKRNSSPKEVMREALEVKLNETKDASEEYRVALDNLDKPKKSTNKEIKRARSMSAIQKVFY